MEVGSSFQSGDPGQLEFSAPLFWGKGYVIALVPPFNVPPTRAKSGATPGRPFGSDKVFFNSAFDSPPTRFWASGKVLNERDYSSFPWGDKDDLTPSSLFLECPFFPPPPPGRLRVFQITLSHSSHFRGRGFFLLKWWTPSFSCRLLCEAGPRFPGFVQKLFFLGLV